MLGSQIYLTDETHSLSFDEKLTELGKPGSARLHGVWWLPSPTGGVNLVLSNTTNTMLSVSTTIRGKSPKRDATTTVDVAPHETKVLNIERDLLGREQGALSSFGAISIEHNGGPGALLARAMAQDNSRGYSLPIQFTDPATAKSNNLHGAGLRLGSARRESLSPTVVVHNAGGTLTTLNGRVPYTTTSGNQGEIILPQLQLSSGETDVIDIAPYVKAHGINGEVTAAGLEFQYSGELGSVITSAFSVSRSGNQVFRVPLWDIAAQRSGTGGYPWYIEGDSSTVIYIKNVTDEIQKYRMYLKLTGGDYVFPLTTVAPHQTTVIDVRKLRDTQVPDVNGQTIPVGEKRGQVQWSLTGGVDRVVIGRSEQVDLVRGFSSNYACQNCCPNSFFDGWVTPVQSTGFQGEQIQYIAMQQDGNCYGQVYPAYQAGTPFYTSSDLSICNPDFNTGTTTGGVPGESIINAAWTADAWLFTPTADCDYTPEEVVREALCTMLFGRVDFTTVTFSNISADFNQFGSATLNLGTASGGTGACTQGASNTFSIRVKFNMPEGASSITTGVGTFVSDNANQKWQYSSFAFENVSFAAPPKGDMVIRLFLARPTAPKNSISLRISGRFPDGEPWTGGATVHLLCP